MEEEGEEEEESGDDEEEEAEDDWGRGRGGFSSAFAIDLTIDLNVKCLWVTAIDLTAMGIFPA